MALLGRICGTLSQPRNLEALGATAEGKGLLSVITGWIVKYGEIKQG
jgi:hypothetical protein